jgi:hypothetical protein
MHQIPAQKPAPEPHQNGAAQQHSLKLSIVKHVHFPSNVYVLEKLFLFACTVPNQLIY